LHPRSFEYFAPQTIRETIALLNKYKDEAKILAGGHSLIPLMKLRLASPKYILDINRIPGLSYIKESGKDIRIGALTRYYEIESSGLLKKYYPIFPETAQMIGDVQVRNMGTLGGNVVHADPANDFPVTMVAVGAEFVVRGPRGQRTIKANEFFLDVFTTKLKFNEVLTEIRVPLPPPRSGGSFQKFERKAGDFAIVTSAVQISLDNQGRCKNVGIGLGAAGPTVIKAVEAEKVFVGHRPEAELVERAADRCSDVSHPTSDIRGSAEYKKEMVKVFFKRAFYKALNLASKDSRKPQT
jgi:carbon-monoxide dehydrogenase medium subunit